MKNVKITVMRKACYPDLTQQYENIIEHACAMEEGQVFLSIQAKIPRDFCESAWQNLYPYVLTLAHGGSDFYDGWMKNPHTAMISCNDGFRPVSFLLEAQED